jgi:hypothetical protein
VDEAARECRGCASACRSFRTSYDNHDDDDNQAPSVALARKLGSARPGPNAYLVEIGMLFGGLAGQFRGLRSVNPTQAWRGMAQAG